MMAVASADDPTPTIVGYGIAESPFSGPRQGYEPAAGDPVGTVNQVKGQVLVGECFGNGVHRVDSNLFRETSPVFIANSLAPGIARRSGR